MATMKQNSAALDELLQKINNLPEPGGKDPVLVPLQVTLNEYEKLWTPSGGADGFSEVKVPAVQTEIKTALYNGEVTPSPGKYLQKVIVNVLNSDLPAPILLNENTTLVAHCIVAGQSAATCPVPAEFVAEIIEDYTSKGSASQGYVYAISDTDQSEITNGFVASCEQFLITSVTDSAVNITYASAYHKWWQKTNGNITQKEVNGNGFVLGSVVNNVNTTITPEAGVATTNAGMSASRTYDISVLRIGKTDYVPPVIETQEKSATPTESAQDIVPDSGKYLSKVTIAAIPNTYVGTAADANIQQQLQNIYGGDA